MNWKQFLTEKVLKGCWHDIEDHGPFKSKCCKCGMSFGAIHTSDWNPQGFNHTFDNRNDLLDLYGQIKKDGKLISFLNYLNSVCDWKDFDPIRDRALRYLFNWLFCLDGSSYEEKCKMVSEFYGWKEAVAIHS